jgi:uncharacterized membrane protein YhaH (DUF805 family)
MSFGKSIELFWLNYFNFTGRSRRSEYWFPGLFVTLVGFAIWPIDFLVFAGTSAWEWGGLFGWLWALATVIPTLSLGARRLHDVGLSAWFLLFYLLIFIGWIVLVVLFVLDSQSGTNRWGPSPKASASGGSPESPMATPRTSAAPPTGSSEGLDSLVALAEMHRSGILTDEEFAAAKKKVLDKQ